VKNLIFLKNLSFFFVLKFFNFLNMFRKPNLISHFSKIFFRKSIWYFFFHKIHFHTYYDFNLYKSIIFNFLFYFEQNFKSFPTDSRISFKKYKLYNSYFFSLILMQFKFQKTFFLNTYFFFFNNLFHWFDYFLFFKFKFNFTLLSNFFNIFFFYNSFLYQIYYC